MLTVSSTSGVIQAIERARSITLTAYVLSREKSPLLISALEAAAERGASVRVRVEPRPYAGDGTVAAESAAALTELRSHGADARFAPGPEPFHMKAAVVDGSLFLDDRNWSESGNSTVLETDDADDVEAVRTAFAGGQGYDGHLETVKFSALRSEASLIENASADRIDCESESFGPSPVGKALAARAAAGTQVRLLVAWRDLRDGENLREAATLRALEKAGVQVRVGPDDEKMCVAGDAAWVGSANATGGYPRTTDWGMRTRVPEVVDRLRSRFEENWRAGRSLDDALEGLPGRAGGKEQAVRVARGPLDQFLDR